MAYKTVIFQTFNNAFQTLNIASWYALAIIAHISRHAAKRPYPTIH